MNCGGMGAGGRKGFNPATPPPPGNSKPVYSSVHTVSLRVDACSREPGRHRINGSDIRLCIYTTHKQSLVAFTAAIYRGGAAGNQLEVSRDPQVAGRAC